MLPEDCKTIAPPGGRAEEANRFYVDDCRLGPTYCDAQSIFGSEDRAVFEGFADLEMEEGFDLSWVRRKMQRSFGPRGETGYFEFRRPDFNKQYELPERFFGIF